jgi:hypothetical protein
VGLPVAIAALQILNGKIKLRRTTHCKEVYLPLNELEDYGVVLKSNRPYFGYSQIEFFSLVKQIRFVVQRICCFIPFLSCRLLVLVNYT